MKKQFIQSLLLVTLLVGCVNSTKADETISLSGTWKFRLDADDVGVAEQWYAWEFEDTVQLTDWLKANCNKSHLQKPNPKFNPDGPLPFDPYVPFEQLKAH
jgi:hypothetical protein